MKVKVKEYVQTIYELPDDHFNKLINDNGGGYTINDMSDCEIADEFITHGQEIFQDRSYDEDLISWDIKDKITDDILRYK
jgi:hypothetical protein|tara:strand:+ start:523 stop:762 length:240 start_codon:yes stop_codon:yes gene_type:complete